MTSRRECRRMWLIAESPRLRRSWPGRRPHQQQPSISARQWSVLTGARPSRRDDSESSRVDPLLRGPAQGSTIVARTEWDLAPVRTAAREQPRPAPSVRRSAARCRRDPPHGDRRAHPDESAPAVRMAASEPLSASWDAAESLWLSRAHATCCRSPPSGMAVGGRSGHQDRPARSSAPRRWERRPASARSTTLLCLPRHSAKPRGPFSATRPIRPRVLRAVSVITAINPEHSRNHRAQARSAVASITTMSHPHG